MSNPFVDGLSNLDISKSAGATVSKVDPATIPGFVPGNKSGPMPANFRVKYKRLNCSNDEDLAFIEDIETRAFRNEGVYVISKERFTFMDQILILLNYIETDQQ